ncbi:unnamed protein product [Phytophthora lilii]|uniref:Unnamed protein product n=1 Tax=Phytophthora lilii TaxID=2077276 RepID=A0A9W6TYE1_9STRA|nr:unnamed protein product [Phytophthora lilii]
MEVAKLRQDLTLCWLAETLVQVLERTATQCQADKLVLVSLGDATVAAQGAALSKLANGFLRRSTALNGSSACNFEGGCYVHMKDVDELRQWRVGDDSQDTLSGKLVVVYAPCEEEAAMKHVGSIVQTVSDFWDKDKIVLLVLHNPDGLLGLEPASRVMKSSSTYHLQHFADSSTLTESDWRMSLRFAAQPLDCLRDQCGWHFVTEIVRWVPESAGTLANKEDVFGAARATMFSTINQLPFQLLLLVLRWSHFHPQLVEACAKKLQRQTQLIPQARFRRELAELERHEMQLWEDLYPVSLLEEKTTSPLKQEQIATPLFLDQSSQSEVVSSKLAPLSECSLWDTQKQFYKDQGIRAWSSGAIPFGVSSSSFLASAYARIAVDFLLSNADYVKPSFKENSPPNCFVWEAASGSCKFLHSFMLHFTELVEANDEFKRRGLVPMVIATDLSEQVLSSRRQMSCFQPYIECGKLDFALFDTNDFIHGNPSISMEWKTLELMHSQRDWRVGCDGPVALMGNYFFDSLRADIFTVATQPEDPTNDASPKRVVIQAALLDKDTLSIADMAVSLHRIENPRTEAVYEDSRLNTTLIDVLEKFTSGASASSSPISSTGLIIFPTEAFEFILTLVDRDSDNAAFPVSILAGDARFSFRDAISSAFVTTTIIDGNCGDQGKKAEPTKRVGLELPQLSPHPDCFCLPVDFEIFSLFFQHLNSNAADIFASSLLVSAPASDTFDVFFATVKPQQRNNCSVKGDNVLTTISFRQQFVRFTPGDCDLLWGMMSFDDGACCFSVDTLLALLAQTGWDFDLFAVLLWELLNRLRRRQVDVESERYQHILIDAGIKSWRTFYYMEQRTEAEIATRKIRLQLARWFYGKAKTLSVQLRYSLNILLLCCAKTELEDYESVLEVLKPWRDEAHKEVSADDVGIFYLLGVRCFLHFSLLCL